MDLLIILYKIFSVIIFVALIYYSINILCRVLINKAFDSRLNISTRGRRSWDKNKIYNRTESTPYLALDNLADKYPLSINDYLIDFGCGKGRVALYFNARFGLNVTGIEINQESYLEALENKENCKVKNDNIHFVKQYAEQYEIKNENKFFFFNPFDSSIFEKVLKNIIDNANENKKEVDIILYYPIKSYKKIMKDSPFELKMKVKPSGAIGPTEKFEIYTYEGR